MNIKIILSVIALAGLLTACGKEEAAKPVAPAQAPVAAPAPTPAPAQPAQAGDKPADTAADGNPLPKDGVGGRGGWGVPR